MSLRWLPAAWIVSWFALMAIAGISQVPVAHIPERQSSYGSQDEHFRSWDTPPSPDGTGHLIFDTVAGLLKHWPNSYYRNGHIVVPATIAPGTLLYHGRPGWPGPSEFEWLSFDADHSLGFAYHDNDGYLYTYSAMRELKVLHLDGSSAARLSTGTLDTQAIILYGNVTADEFDWMDIDLMIKNMCKWGKDYGFDGFLRMSISFEVMLCDFSNGLELVSEIHVVPSEWSVPMLPECPPGPQQHTFSNAVPPDCDNVTEPQAPFPGWKGSGRTYSDVAFAMLGSGSLHENSPITGVRLDYSRLLSFYDPKYSSLVAWRRTISERRFHRVANISSEDSHAFQQELHDVLSRPDNERGSGVAWDHLIRHIVERQADYISWLSWLLREVNADEDVDFNATQTMIYVRQHVLTMLSPYLSVNSVPSPESQTSSNEWLGPAVQRCSASYTARLPTSLFTPQEALLKSSIDQTTHEICRTLGIIWTTAFTAELATAEELPSLLRGWKIEVDRLGAWLGWPLFVKCEPACGETEVCVLPQFMINGVYRGDEPNTPHCAPRIGWHKKTNSVP